MKNLWNWLLRRNWAAACCASLNVTIAGYEQELHKPAWYIVADVVFAATWALFWLLGSDA